VLFLPGPAGEIRSAGRPALANTIAFNRFNGRGPPGRDDRSGNRIPGPNSIYANRRPWASDLGNNGFTLNDALDADARGPNGLARTFP